MIAIRRTALAVGLSSLFLAPAARAATEGVDVSEYQGTVDWSAVAGSGVTFAIARVSDGLSHPDADFANNWQGIANAGLVRGVYQFFRPQHPGADQADLLVSKIGGALGAGDLPPVLDVEVKDGVADATIVAEIGAWVARVKSQLGVEPLVYTSPGFWSGISGASTFSTDLWVAHWGVSSPTVPHGWSSWKLWQYSDSGTVPGISGAVDRDRFNGSVADLRAYAARSSTTASGGGSTTSGATTSGGSTTTTSSSGSRSGSTGASTGGSTTTTTSSGGTATSHGSGSTATSGGSGSTASTTPGGSSSSGGTRPTGAVYFEESFEAAPYGGVGASGPATSAGNGWAVGAVAGAFDGSSVAAIGWGGYPANANDVMTTPPLDLSRATHPVLDFHQVYDIESRKDAGKIGVWDGSQWTFPEPQGGYPVASLVYAQPESGWYTGKQLSWQEQTFDLSAVAGHTGVVVAFWFRSDPDDSTEPAGWGGYWAVDAVLVAEASASTAPAGAATVVFEEGFEGATSQCGSLSATQTPEWSVDDPSQYATPGLPAAAAQGSYCAGTKFSSFYDDDAEDLLYTAEIDLSGKTSATLTFEAAFDLATDATGASALDGVRVLATPDLGQTWYLVSPQPSYPYGSCAALTDAQGNSTPAFSGSTGGAWTTYSVDLTSALAFAPRWTFAWEFASGANGGGAGFFLDEIRVTAR